ncbi:MAG: hypothetical protein Q7R72_00400 [bacterium]|nr:hypothetical protein [bacterium]
MKAQILLNELLEHGVLLHTWGLGEAKTFEHLLLEIDNGEVSIRSNGNGKLVWESRAVAVRVTCRIRGFLWLLVEGQQVFIDGRTRTRPWVKELNVSVIEKLHRNELPDEASAKRALNEELTIPKNEIIEFWNKHPVVRVGPLPSQSYPGLVCEFDMYRFEWEMNPRLWNPDGYVEIQTDKSTHFVWEKL